MVEHITLTKDEITTKSFESYGKLDELGRCTTATACIGKDLMPTKDRESIAGVKPTGWKHNTSGFREKSCGRIRKAFR